MFRRANDVLRDLGLTYWIDCGVLLGAHREGDFLPHDPDIDFGVWGVSKHVQTADAFGKAGFDRGMFHGTWATGLNQSFIRKNVKVDLIYFYPHERGSWQASWDGDRLLTSIFQHPVIPPKPYRFKDTDTFAPADIEGMLTARYGDWTQVVTEWDWRTDPKCIE